MDATGGRRQIKVGSLLESPSNPRDLARGKRSLPANNAKFGGLRLLFDENCSPYVAMALCALTKSKPEQFAFVNGRPSDAMTHDGFPTSADRDSGAALPKGTKDPEVCRFAKSRNYVVVTSDSGLLDAAVASGIRVVHLHSSVQGSRYEQMDIVLSQLTGWQAAFAELDTLCVVLVRKTLWKAVEPRRAQLLIRRRKRRQSTARPKRRIARPQGEEAARTLPLDSPWPGQS